MKRWIVLLLALCLLGGSASAEGLRVFGMGWGADDAYQAAYPDRALEKIEVTYDDTGRGNTRQFLLGNPDAWDTAFIWSNDCGLAALDGAGLLMDLRGEGGPADAVADMYAAVRSALSVEGRVLAVPVFFSGSVMQLAMDPYARIRPGEEVDLLTPLGLTMDDAPRTFDELCALAERYMALPKEARKGRVFHIDAAAGNPKAYFLQYLINLYTAQYCDADGQVSYDTPVFWQALESLEGMAEALRAEPKVTYGPNGGLYGLVHDASSTLLTDYSHLLYLRVGDNASIPAQMNMLVVNANTPRKAEALDFLSCAMQSTSAYFGPALFETLDYEALARRAYDDNIAAQIHQNEDQSVIDKLIRERDSGEYPGFISREAIARYARDVAPHLTFPRTGYLDSYTIAAKYAKGPLDVEGLIDALEHAAK